MSVGSVTIGTVSRRGKHRRLIKKVHLFRSIIHQSDNEICSSIVITRLINQFCWRYVVWCTDIIQQFLADFTTINTGFGWFLVLNKYRNSVWYSNNLWSRFAMNASKSSTLTGYAWPTQLTVCYWQRMVPDTSHRLPTEWVCARSVNAFHTSAVNANLLALQILDLDRTAQMDIVNSLSTFLSYLFVHGIFAITCYYY